MKHRVLPLLVAALTLALLAGASTWAADKDKDKDGKDKGKTHEGVVVKAGDGKLTMTDKDGKAEHTHDVAKDATVTCDGKKCKLEDLKKGFTVKVTLGEKNTATRIEAKKSDKGKGS